MTPLAPLLQSFFSDRLMTQCRVSPHTISAYRDTFRLLLGFASLRLKKTPCDLSLEDLHAELIGDFLSHLERSRKNGIRTRNARLAAIRSFFRYLAAREPTRLGMIQRVLAIPQKRFERNIVRFLTEAEIQAILEAPDTHTWIGRRARSVRVRCAGSRSRCASAS